MPKFFITRGGKTVKVEAVDEAAARAMSDRTVVPPAVSPMRAGMKECVSCGREISVKAKTCPHCGHPYEVTYWDKVQKTQRGIMWFAIIFVTVSFLIALGYSLSQGR